MPSSRRPHSQGFTLIELMVAVVIAAIVAAIAYPAYTKQMQRGRRAGAVAALTAVMQSQERYRSNHSSYATTLTDLGGDISSITSNYSVSDPTGVVPLAGGLPDPKIGYVATATPTSTGKQTGDKTCKSFTVEMRGGTATYSAKGDPNNTGTDGDTTADCWPK